MLLTLCHLALDDGRVIRFERAELRSMATILGLPAGLATDTLGDAEDAEDARNVRLSAGLHRLAARGSAPGR